jgi:hypothetical protein
MHPGRCISGRVAQVLDNRLGRRLGRGRALRVAGDVATPAMPLTPVLHDDGAAVVKFDPLDPLEQAMQLRPRPAAR